MYAWNRLVPFKLAAWNQLTNTTSSAFAAAVLMLSSGSGVQPSSYATQMAYVLAEPVCEQYTTAASMRPPKRHSCGYFDEYSPRTRMRSSYAESLTER